MHRKSGMALLLSISMMFSSVSVGATTVPSPAPTSGITQEVEDESGNEMTEGETEENTEAQEGEQVTPTPTTAPTPEATPEPTTEVTPIPTATPAPETTPEVEEKVEKKVIGPVTILEDGRAYVSDANGNRITTAGTPVINGKKYYVASDGYLRNGWLILGDWKMYFDKEDYAAKTGMADIDEKRYLFNNDGVIQNFAGTTIVNGKKYWFSTDNASLKTGWLYLGDWKLYFDPETYEAKTGMADIGGKRYLFNSDGVMQNFAGTPVIDGKKYWFSTEGYLKSGWLYLKNWKLYFDPETYQAKVGMADIGGKRYLFNRDGVMQTYAGTTIIDGKKYWFSTDDASLKTGWLELGNMKLYFDPKTYQGVTGLAPIAGEYYYFNEDGVMQIGLRQLSSTSYYYFQNDGTMLRNGSVTVNGQKLNFGADGICTNPGSIMANYKGPYKLTVDRVKNVVTVYGDDGSGNFKIPVKSFVCSVGNPWTPTPVGTFRTGAQQKVKELMGPSWGQYSTHVVGGIYFHSVASSSASDPGHNVPIDGYYALGGPASHGCIRLLVGDAYWIYCNVKPGTIVEIGDNLPSPLGKPSVPKMVTPGVDPTDPFNK